MGFPSRVLKLSPNRCGTPRRGRGVVRDAGLRAGSLAPSPKLLRSALSVAFVLTLGGCGASGGSSQASSPDGSAGKTTAVPASSDGSPSADSSGTAPYSGLGALERVFIANNAQEPPNLSGAPAGLAWYTVTQTDAKRRVIAYQIGENAVPAMDSRTRLSLGAGIYLPTDATETQLNSDTCLVYKSSTLRRLIGYEYAALTATPGTRTANVRAEQTPQC